MKKWTFILCLAVLLASCDNLLKSIPDGTLSEKDMTDLLVDIHLTEATLRVANDSLVRFEDTTNIRIRFAQVFRDHDVTPEQFSSSLNYYIEHIEELDKIYIEVISQLTVLNASFQPKIEKDAKAARLDQKSIEVMNNPWARALYNSRIKDQGQYFDTIKKPMTIRPVE